MGIDEFRRDEVILRVDATPVADGQRSVLDRVADWTPDIDDTDTAFEEALCVLGEMITDSVESSLVCLVDVDAFLVLKTLLLSI